jgi:radical SAM superfamily enzyme YgiQ (UPF0313 family)
MKILFVVTQMNFCEPMGAMQLAAVTKKAGYIVEMAAIHEEDVCEVARNFGPDLIAVSCMSPEATLCLQTCRELKRDGHVIVMGGPHPTFFPEVVDEGCIDAICVGEGEGAILDILEHLNGGKPLSGIPNVMTSSTDVLELRPLIKDLDALPFLERELVYRYPGFASYRLRSFFTGRGCIYNCTYCFNAGYKKLYKNKGPILRRRSPRNIIDEIIHVRTHYAINFVRFSDDTFIYKLDPWALEFLEVYKKEIALPFYCLLRADTVTEELAEALRNAGCYSVSMSIESGVEEIRRTLLRRNVSNETIIQAVAILQNRGILVQSSCMFGLPGTTFDNDVQTMELALTSRVFMPGFGMFMPYPGTELGQLCRDRHFFEGDLAQCSSYQQPSPLSCFTPQDKQARHNLMLLATFICKFPIFKSLVVKRLVHGKTRKIYYFINWLVSGYLSRKSMCPSLSATEWVKLLWAYIRFYRNNAAKSLKADA